MDAFLLLLLLVATAIILPYVIRYILIQHSRGLVAPSGGQCNRDAGCCSTRAPT